MADDWSNEELAASIAAYKQMQELEASGRPYTKKGIYRGLAMRFGRTEKSFEYRMQNISAVLDELGMPWIAGLRPAVNVGANVKMRLVALLTSPEDAEDRRTPDYKTKLPAIRTWLIHVARAREKVTYGDVMEAFDIDRFSLRHAMGALGHEARSGGEPIITALIVGKESGDCSEGLRKEFGIEDGAAERQKLYAYWQEREQRSPNSDAGDARLVNKADRFASVAVRPEQAAFRRRVFLAWGGRCAITECDVRSALDAAHRKGRDWRAGHNLASDGLLLRKDLHALYDAGLLGVSDQGVVSLDPSIRGHYGSLEGQRLRSYRDPATRER